MLQIECLADALVKAPFIAKLDLSGNAVTVAGARALVNAQQQQVLLVRFQQMPPNYIVLSSVNLQKTSVPPTSAQVQEISMVRLADCR